MNFQEIGMKQSVEEIKALKRADATMYRVVVGASICAGMSLFVGWELAAIAGLVVVSVPLCIWFAAEFSAWDRGGPAGEAKRAEASTASLTLGTLPKRGESAKRNKPSGRQ